MIKKIFFALCIFSSELVFCQSHNIPLLKNILLSEMSITKIKEILKPKYTYKKQDDITDNGNIAYYYDSKDGKHNELVVLYSTIFNKATFFQLMDYNSTAQYYRNQFAKLGFTFLKKNYDFETGRNSYGYRKGALLFVVELGVEENKCQIKLSDEDN